MHVEIDSPEDLAHHLSGGRGLARTVVQGLDLRPHAAAIVAHPATNAVLLGCRATAQTSEHVLATGGLIFPRLEGLPFQPYRAALYTPDELMDGYRRGEPDTFAQTRDQLIYRYFQSRRSHGAPGVLDTLAQRLHDHAIDDSLADFLTRGRWKVCAIMGGHAMKRDEPDYLAIARLAQRLAQRDEGYLVASGGGPGAMEATHLGAWMAGYDDAALERAVAALARAPSFDHPQWLETAYEVRETWREPAESLGIPTWFYGHEPVNLFATRVAKYFSNSLREDGLLAIAHHGVIYAPGSAGTVQEVFQDAAQNHYGTFGDVSPMVFFGRIFWTERLPVMSLLERLSKGRQYADMIGITDDVDEAVELVVSRPPVPID